MFNNIYEYHDMFNYYQRIKKINKNYLLCFDNINKFFIILNTAKNNQICLKFNNFCLNIEKILQKTKIENASKLFVEIDENNKKLVNSNLKNAKNDMTNKILDLNSYCKRTNKILQSDIDKIIGVKNV